MNDLIKKQNKNLTIALIVFIFLFIAFCIFSSSIIGLLLFLLLFISLSGIIFTIKELIFFNENFGNPDKHLVNWEYPNGDKLIITCWGLLKHNTSPPKFSASSKFEGIKWDLDNAKDLAESLIKNEGHPLLTLLPSIEFSTKTNRVPDFISFSFVDNIDLTFIEIDEGYLIVSIEKKNIHSKYTLTYPLPPSRNSLENESDIFEKRIADRKTPVRGLFIGKSLLKDA